MRIACWASALLILCAACTNARRAAGGSTSAPAIVRSTTERGQTRVDLRSEDGGRKSVLLARDGEVAADSDPLAVALVGFVPPAIVLVDSYRSAPGGLSYCQAGEERFLRVVSLAGRDPSVTLALKVASCRSNLELADPGIEWDAATRTVRVRWVTGPSGAPENRAITIGADGSAHVA